MASRLMAVASKVEKLGVCSDTSGALFHPRRGTDEQKDVHLGNGRRAFKWRTRLSGGARDSPVRDGICMYVMLE